MRKLLVLIAVMTMTVGVAVPVSAAPTHPPEPKGWTTDLEATGTFFFWNINPCTGQLEEWTTERVMYVKEHKGEETGTRRFYVSVTTDGWSTSGWVHASTSVQLRPGGGHILTSVYSVPVFEDDGRGVMFARTSTTSVELADGTLVVNHKSPWELSCAGNSET